MIAEALIRESSSAPLPAWRKGMTMNVALHLGTLSMAVVCFKDLQELLEILGGEVTVDVGWQPLLLAR